ncbi:hypothetical protein K8353_10260 [Burkholderia contaminans]|nr:hypothetical protein [Burkholderia contaminans]
MLTATGNAIGIDPCIRIVPQDFGMENVNVVARGIVMAPHREGSQSPSIPRPAPKRTSPSGNARENAIRSMLWRAKRG